MRVQRDHTEYLDIFAFLSVIYLLYEAPVFLSLLSPFHQLCSIPPITWTRSISAANAANLLNRNAWRPNCFSFEALRPSPRSQMGLCPLPLYPFHSLLFSARAIPRAIPFSATRKTREYDAPVFFYLFLSSFAFVRNTIVFLCVVHAPRFSNFNFYAALHTFILISFINYILLL